MEKQNLAPKEPKMQVNVYGMVGECQVGFETNSSTWGQLKKDLDSRGIQHKDMRATVGETQEELTEDEQEIKMKELSLFLTPMKVKSGKSRTAIQNSEVS